MVEKQPISEKGLEYFQEAWRTNGQDHFNN